MKKAVQEFLGAVDDRGWGREITATPERVATAWSDEILSGYREDPAEILRPMQEPARGGIVVVRDIEFLSVCVHHLLPFYGRAHVAYQPGERLVGVSKLARLVDCHSRRLQIQEALTRQIVADLMRHLDPAGAACIMEASHLCMMIRGAEKKESRVVTTSLAGVFEEPGRREELYRILSG
jgi:GTP cyclohydrolase I